MNKKKQKTKAVKGDTVMVSYQSDTESDNCVKEIAKRMGITVSCARRIADRDFVEKYSAKGVPA